MNLFTKTLLSAALISSFSAQADTVVRAVPDTAPGKGYGGVTGLMVGSVGGPLGALVGAGLGWMLGGESQGLLGLEGKAYEVKTSDGRLVTVRSPKVSFEPGEQVIVSNGRLIKKPETMLSMTSL